LKAEKEDECETKRKAKKAVKSREIKKLKKKQKFT